MIVNVIWKVYNGVVVAPLPALPGYRMTRLVMIQA